MNVDEIEKRVSYIIFFIFAIVFVICRIIGWEASDIVTVFNYLLVAVLILVVVGMILNKIIAIKKHSVLCYT